MKLFNLWKMTCDLLTRIQLIWHAVSRHQSLVTWGELWGSHATWIQNAMETMCSLVGCVVTLILYMLFHQNDWQLGEAGQRGQRLSNGRCHQCIYHCCHVCVVNSVCRVPFLFGVREVLNHLVTLAVYQNCSSRVRFPSSFHWREPHKKGVLLL